MKRALIDDFFASWKPVDFQKGENCPPDRVLVSWAKDAALADKMEHLVECEHCRTIVNLLQETAKAPGKNLSVFLDETRKLAGEVVGKRTASREFPNLGTSGRHRVWQVASYAAAGIALVLSLGWGLINRKAPSQFVSQQEARLSLDPSPYLMTLDFLQESTKETASGEVRSEKRAAIAREYRIRSSKIDFEKLKPEQVTLLNQEVEALQDLFRRQYLSEVKRTENESIHADKVADLFVTYSRYDLRVTLPDQAGFKVAPLPIVEPGAAIKSASSQIQVQDLGDMVVVKPIAANLDLESTPWVHDAMLDYAHEWGTRVEVRSAKGVTSFRADGRSSFIPADRGLIVAPVVHK